MDSLKEVKIPFSTIVDIVRNLSDDLKNELFERVFIEYDTSSLSEQEKKFLNEGLAEYEKGETISWQKHLSFKTVSSQWL